MARKTKYDFYDESFKATAVELGSLPGVYAKDVAEVLDIHPIMLYRWQLESVKPVDYFALTFHPTIFRTIPTPALSGNWIIFRQDAKLPVHFFPYTRIYACPGNSIFAPLGAR